MLTAVLADNALSDAIADELKFVLFFGCAFGLAAVLTVAGTLKSIFATRAREHTKRELAAYVAEGSVKPEDAVRILTAGNGTDACEIIAKRAADGWISAKKADQLIQALEKQNAVKA